MKAILVAVDFRKSSTAACLYANSMAKELKTELILAYVYEKPLVSSKELNTSLIKDFNSKMKRYVAKLQKQDPEFQPVTVILEGDIDTAILNFAEKKDVALIVCGASGFGKVANAILGNPSLTIMRKASCPVLIVQETAKFKGLKKMVYATDLSDQSLKMASNIIPLAKIFKSEMVFLYVDLLLGKKYAADMPGLTKRIKSRFRYPKVSGFICDDVSIDKGIEFFIEKMKPDCMVLYAPHYSLFGRLLHKSTIKNLSLRSRVPLLIIHEKDRVKSSAGKIQKRKITSAAL
jgi:nucleotide-binding universal stress UspA family protein